MQAGFRAGYSTSGHVFVLKHLTNLFRHKRENYFVYLWLFEKRGINGKVINETRNTYRNIISCVSLNQELSDYFVSYTGVRQRENLSPLLFSLYVNDPEELFISNRCNYLECGERWLDEILKVLVLMSANDTVIMSHSEDVYVMAY